MGLDVPGTGLEAPGVGLVAPGAISEAPGMSLEAPSGVRFAKYERHLVSIHTKTRVQSGAHFAKDERKLVRNRQSCAVTLSGITKFHQSYRHVVPIISSMTPTAP